MSSSKRSEVSVRPASRSNSTNGFEKTRMAGLQRAIGQITWDIVDRNLDVNPDPSKCKLSDVPIPYLWWGLRAADVGAENGVAADAIATYDRFLAPHLAAMFLKVRNGASWLVPSQGGRKCGD